jgi:LDH2 family malate/lactate/ureidoglycolate dehydrogenase
MESAGVRVRHEPLTRFVAAIYERGGMPPGEAALIADSLVQADLWGHQSHGVLRTSWYLARLKSGRDEGGDRAALRRRRRRHRR